MSEHPKISAVLICKESTYPSIVMERLTLGFFDEILVHTDCPNIYSRYLLSKQAKNDIIYVQDSDCLVNYQVLFQKFDGRITNTMTLPFQKQYEPLGCTLIGWGAYFNKKHLEVFQKYIDRYGEDEHLLREADRVFTFLNRNQLNTIIQPHEDLNQSGGRMSTNPDGSIIQSHFDSRDEALRKCSLL